MPAETLRLAAFADGAGGGNPAGVVLDAAGMTDAAMLDRAAAVGYAETAFVTGTSGTDPVTVGIRYFSPVAEVPFCGHATVATAVVLAERSGFARMRFSTAAGPFEVDARSTADGVLASFTSPEPSVAPVPDEVLQRLLAELGLRPEQLADDHPPRLSDTGNVIPVLVLASAADLDGLTFDPDALRALMLEQGWLGTVTVLHRIGPLEYEARNPFPAGTLIEDPATGSAAASTGAYLRAVGLIDAPARVLIRQGRHVGRPSLLVVDVPAEGGIRVTGGATPILA